jgi:hypothetical protein
MSYDTWKTNVPGGECRPLTCDCCGDRFFTIEDHNEHEVHCRDEDTDEPVGRLVWDWGYDWRDDDPNIP